MPDYSLADLNALVTRHCPFGAGCPFCEERPADSAQEGGCGDQHGPPAPEVAPATPPPEEGLSRGEFWLVVGVLLGVALWCWRG